MKKIIAILLAVAMFSLMLVGCSSDSKDNENSDTNQNTSTTAKPDVKGEMFDAGNVRVLVPEGWKAFPQKDAFSDDGAMDPDVIYISKGAKSDLDMMSHPAIRIDYYGVDREMMGGLKDWYSDTEDLKPMQCGPYKWEGFTTTDYDLMAILVAVDGVHEYQATVYLEVDGQSIDLNDKDVQAILATVEPSDGSGSASSGAAAETVVDADFSWWNDDWYGWWCIKNGTGAYEPASEIAWDAYAEIEVYNDNTGRVTLWDTGTAKSDPLIVAYDITFDEGLSDKGSLTSKRVVVFPGGAWNNGMEAVTMDERSTGWTIDPAISTVSHFDNMIEIVGHYESPENANDSFDYFIYLRPWGTLWEDVRSGDTSGCIYKDMMPLYYDNWYVSLLNLGYERPTSSFQEGIDVINDYIASQNTDSSAAGALDPAAKAGADGKVDMMTLKAGLQWCKDNAEYTTPYDEIAAQFGVHGKSVESLFENRTIYRWWATEEAYVQITFAIAEDGSETWNVTQYDGID